MSLFTRSLGAFAILMLLWLAAPAVLSSPTKAPAHAVPVTAEACLAPSSTPSPSPEVAGCHRLALALAEARDYDRAIAIETRMFERDPMNAEVATSLARMQDSGRKDVVQALRMYHEALYAVPGYPAALMGLGSHWKGRGESLIAERYFARGARENPDQPQFQVRLAEVLVEGGRQAEAAPILQAVVERFPASGEAEDARRLLSRTALARP